MALYGLILFVIYGWVEFEAMAAVVDGIGGLAAFLGIFVTAIAGIQLLRLQSGKMMAEFRANLAKGELKSDAIAGSFALIAGAILMLIPGYVTDAIGLLCFVPGLRTIIGRFIAGRMATSRTSGFYSGFNAGTFGRNPFGDNQNSSQFSSFRENDDFSEAFGDDNESTRQPYKRKSPSYQDDDIIEGEFKEKN